MRLLIEMLKFLRLPGLARSCHSLVMTNFHSGNKSIGMNFVNILGPEIAQKRRRKETQQNVLSKACIATRAIIVSLL